MVRVKYLLLAALALLNDVQGLQMERSARRSKSWIEHKTLSGKRVDKEQIEVNKLNLLLLLYVLLTFFCYFLSLHLL